MPKSSRRTLSESELFAGACPTRAVFIILRSSCERRWQERYVKNRDSLDSVRARPVCSKGLSLWDGGDAHDFPNLRHHHYALAVDRVVGRAHTRCRCSQGLRHFCKETTNKNMHTIYIHVVLNHNIKHKTRKQDTKRKQTSSCIEARKLASSWCTTLPLSRIRCRPGTASTTPPRR